MDYRLFIRHNTYVAEESDIKSETQFMLLKDVEMILDDMESHVREIEESLDAIQGLSEIDEVKQAVKDLASSLY
jgi:uncharacterized protein YoxC